MMMQRMKYQRFASLRTCFSLSNTFPKLIGQVAFQPTLHPWQLGLCDYHAVFRKRRMILIRGGKNTVPLKRPLQHQTS